MAVEALRTLRAPWRALFVTDHAVEIQLADGRGVRIEVVAADVEDQFEAFTLTAVAQPVASVGMDDVSAFASGSNDVVMFTGVTWSEPGAAVVGAASGAVMQFSGHPGQLTETAEIACVTTDAFVVASPLGVGILVRTGLKPYSLQVIRERETISSFLLERGYQSD